MKAYVIGDQTGIDSLHLVDRPDPVPGPGEALLRVRAVCLGHRDLDIVSGTYGPRRDEKRIPLSEGVGEVIALGEDAVGVAIGDRVICGHFVDWIAGAFSTRYFATDLGVTHDGWLAETIAVPAAALVKLPDGMSDAAAGALSASALTAWQAVVTVGHVKPGDVVLALGTGGVSIAALQIAKAKGARVAITSSSDEKLALARELGADLTINYRTTPDWPAALMQATDGAGANIVLETGGQQTLSQSIAAAAPGARIVVIGVLAGTADKALPNYGAIIGKNLVIAGIASGSRAMLEELVGVVSQHGIAPVIDRTFAFADAAAAYAYLGSAQHVGKVMITMP